jgi:recombination protein RecT
MTDLTTQDQKPKPPLVQFKADLARLKDAGELDMLPANVSFEAFRNAAVVAITDNPSILSCNRESVFKAIRRLAAAGLVPDGREAAIVPFQGNAQAMPMVYGLIKVARNSGEIASIWAEVVTGDETFTISMIDGERKFEHTYDPLKRTGDVMGAYAVAKLKDGTIEIEAMGRDDIEKRRMASANQKGPQPTGIWQKWYSEMAKKTVIRALVKRLPMSSEDQRRVMIEDEDNSVQLQRDVTPKDEGPRVNLAQRILQEEPEPITGEILPPEDEAPDNGMPGSAAWDEGMKAFASGAAVGSCPYDQSTQEAADWLGGFVGARRASE